MKAPAISETTLHYAVAKHLREVLRPPVIWTTMDAGAGKMKPRTARQRKIRGVAKGWPDILILAPGPQVLGIELKAAKGGLKPEQIAVHAMFTMLGGAFAICRSIAEVDMALAVAGIPHNLEAA